MRKPEPRLGFWQFRVQLYWTGGEDEGTHTLPATTIISDRILAVSLNTESRHTPTSWDLWRETPAEVHKEVRPILFAAALVCKGKKLEIAARHRLNMT